MNVPNDEKGFAMFEPSPVIPVVGNRPTRRGVVSEVDALGQCSDVSTCTTSNTDELSPSKQKEVSPNKRKKSIRVKDNCRVAQHFCRVANDLIETSNAHTQKINFPIQNCDMLQVDENHNTLSSSPAVLPERTFQVDISPLDFNADARTSARPAVSQSHKSYPMLSTFILTDVKSEVWRPW